MASGDLGASYKLYVYGLDYDAQYYFAELNIDKKSRQATCTIKTASSKVSAEKFARVVLGM